MSHNNKNLRLFLAEWLFTPLAGILLGNWLHLLLRHGKNIGWRYIPKAIFTTFMALLNSLVFLFEKALYQQKIKRQTVTAPVFIIGHHRSGTTHLWNLLTQDERFTYPSVLQAVFPHTFLIFEKMIHGLAQSFAPKKRPQDNVSMNPDSPIEEERALCTATFLSLQMGRHFPQKRDTFLPLLSLSGLSANDKQRWADAFREFAQKLLLRHGSERTLIFKTPDHTAKVQEILKVFPDARFVHIHRHPYHVFRSTVNMEKTTVPLYAYQKPRLHDLEDFVLRRYGIMYDHLLKSKTEVPARQFTEVAYHEVDENPVETVARIYRDLSLPHFENARPRLERYVDSLQGYRKNRYSDLPAEQKQKINEQWKAVFEAYSYEKETENEHG